MAMDGAAKDIIIVGKLLVRWIIDGIWLVVHLRYHIDQMGICFLKR
jgi:hypothetical protein